MGSDWIETSRELHPQNGVSMRRSDLSRVALCFSFLGFLLLLLVATHVVLHLVSIRTLYEPVALCRLRSRRRSDAASYRSTSSRSTPYAVIGTRVVATVDVIALGRFFVERHVTSCVIQMRCNMTASFRATATTARLRAWLPPRAPRLRPHSRKVRLCHAAQGHGWHIRPATVVNIRYPLCNPSCGSLSPD